MSQEKLPFSTYIQYVAECAEMGICTQCSTCKEPIWLDDTHTCGTVQRGYPLYNIADELKPVFQRPTSNN